MENPLEALGSPSKNWLEELGKNPPEPLCSPSIKGIKPPNTLNGGPTKHFQGKTKADKRLPDRDRWLFVCFTPFTRTEIETGAADGTGPLDSDDVADIERGHYLTENRQQYLRDLLNQAQANRKVSR
jgi:hypothetical protein